MAGLEGRPEPIESPAITNTCDERRESLSLCLSCWRQKVPDLIEVIRAWSTLPEPFRLGIVAMVSTAKAE